MPIETPGLSEAQVQALIDGTVTKSVAATAHNFTAGEVLRMNGAAYVRAQADSEANAEVVGMVASVPDANHFLLQTGGFVVFDDPVLTAGEAYFLSPSVAGAITAIEPSAVGQVSKPIFIATTTGSGYFFNMRGIVVASGAASGGVIGTAVLSIDNADDVTVDYADGVLLGLTGQISATYTGGLLTITYTAGDPGAQNFPGVTWESSASLTASISSVSATGFTATFLNSTTGASPGTAVDVVRITVSKLSQ